MAGISGMEGTLGRPLGRGLEGQVNSPPEVRAGDPCIPFDLTLQPQPSSLRPGGAESSRPPLRWGALVKNFAGWLFLGSIRPCHVRYFLRSGGEGDRMRGEDP